MHNLPVASPLPPTPPNPHVYLTRIRKNTAIHPPARLRSTSDATAHPPRKLKPVTRATLPTAHTNYPTFPLPGIVLHPDDATSKVFIAIGRSFLSVDNRAMTIKDLAEMTVKFGLVCQNVSAASQAITTYIRTHLQRCDVQQDQPLLLRHVLSGTTADDDLLPALHSRSGGAHCSVSPDNRITNFRRGTMVWYLSRSTGAPCPFARAGIRLCDYGEDGRLGTAGSFKEKKQRRVEQCGQKRKRPLRACVARDSDSESHNDDECPPPKVKLTLRLKPLNRFPPSESSQVIDLSKDVSSDSDSDSESESDGHSSSDSMSVDSSDEAKESSPAPPPEEIPWSLPPYPRRSISIPCYTPSTDFPSTSSYHLSYRRSPSIPASIGSPPPDSEDEDDDFHITMTGVRRHRSASRPSGYDPDLEWDADLDSEGEGETMSESPGPTSPYAHLVSPEVVVKEEPTDLQGMLDAWEDFDCSVAGAKVVQVIAQAAACVLESQATKVKTESSDAWTWDSSSTDHPGWSLPSEGTGAGLHVKQEEADLDSPFSLPDDLFPSLGSSPSTSQLPGLSYTPSPSPESSRDDDWNDYGRHYSIVSGPSKVGPSSLSLVTKPIHNTSWASQFDASLSKLTSSAWSSSSISQSLAALIQSMSMSSPVAVVPSSFAVPAPCISPLDTRCRGPSSETVVVQTCQPCHPVISATQIEGISVYQMSLGQHLLLRRIDTDFVNLTPIIGHMNAPHPVTSTIPNAVTITRGSLIVSGTWVPLSAAQAYVRDHSSPQGGPYDIFLSDDLSERFPPALQEFHRTNAAGRTLNQFGPHFRSTLHATEVSCQSGAQSVLSQMMAKAEAEAERQASLVPAPEPRSSTVEGFGEMMMGPLNAEEQEIFREICDIPDESDKENSAPVGTRSEREEKVCEGSGITSGAAADNQQEGEERNDRPLRRSKRVADAIAAQTRNRPRRGGSRNSLS